MQRMERSKWLNVKLSLKYAGSPARKWQVSKGLRWEAKVRGRGAGRAKEICATSVARPFNEEEVISLPRGAGSPV